MPPAKQEPAKSTDRRCTLQPSSVAGKTAGDPHIQKSLWASRQAQFPCSRKTALYGRSPNEPCCKENEHARTHQSRHPLLARGRPAHPLCSGPVHDHRGAIPSPKRFLLKTLTTLCTALEKVNPRIAEIGTRVYEWVA